MARISEHHQPKAGVIGKCSVPLFGIGGPAGFCDRDAYGEQYQGDLSRFFGNNSAPYAPGYCCKVHGGAGEEDVRLMRDGNAWCAFEPDFENLQESVAGFGDTQELALAALLQAKAKQIMTDAVEADRDAAMQMLNHAFRNEAIDGVSGECFDDIAQAFARHRIASQADLLSAVREARNVLHDALMPDGIYPADAEPVIARLNTLLSEQGEAS